MMRALLTLGLCLPMLALAGCTGDGGPAPVGKTVSAGPVVPPGRSLVEGYVTGEELAPIAGALVSVPELGLSLRTTEKGYFTTGPILPGTYRFSAEAAGFSSFGRKVVATEGLATIAIFVLRGVTVPGEYQVSQLNVGFIVCAVAVSPNGFLGLDGSLPADTDCATPRLGSGERSGEVVGSIDTRDRSRHRWVLDEPGAVWREGKLQTRWGATHDLARHLVAELAVDGCTDEGRRLSRTTGPSPLQQPVPAERVRAVLLRAEGTTCGEPGERCDQDACVLSSRVRPAPRPLTPAALGLGVAFQQGFEQELSATFHVVSASEGQTLK